MKFTEFRGNARVKEQLVFLAESGRLPHAIIIEGDEGIGKRTLARELALNLLCRGEDKPCRKCAQCSKVMKGIHPDVYEYTAPNRPAGFHVEEVRKVRDDAFMRPNEADYKIYILGNAQSMNASAQNALLKVLEEPPEYAVFILTVTNKSFMLETVLSRSVVISLEGVSPAEAADVICEKREDVSYEEALSAAEVWGGNIGKALESLTDGKLSKISTLAEKIALSTLAETEYELLKACSAFDRDRETMVAALGMLSVIFRDALIYGEGDMMSGKEELALKLHSRLSRKKLLALINACEENIKLAQGNGNNAVLMTKICYDLRRAQGR